MTPSAALPAGFVAAPVSAVDAGAPLRLCALVRRPAEAGAGALVSLGEEASASRFLGCIVDAGGQVREWLEWSVQAAGAGSAADPGGTGSNNAALDAGWTRRALALAGAVGARCLRTGWESAHPPPMFLDPDGGEPAAADGWELCRDEAALAAAGRPGYAGSRHRYLWKRDAGQPPRFLGVTPGAPGDTGAPDAPDAPDAPGTTAGLFPGYIPFNPAAGLLLAQTFAPLTLEAFADALGGQPWPGLPQGVGGVPLDAPYEALRRMEEPEFEGGHLFGARRGRAGRQAETFHLKLHLLLDAARQVRALVAATRLPMLDLGAGSFRVTLGQPASGLPFLWTARVALVRPGSARAVAVPTTAEAQRYFLPSPGQGPTLYQPAASGQAGGGRGTVRLRQVWAAPGEPVVAEGTLVADENLPGSSGDLLRVQLRLGDGGRVDLYGHLEATESLASGEARFRTVPQMLPAPAADALRAAVGATFAEATFETLPMLGSPCDLYALGVLAVRLLLVNDANTLAVALDGTLSLARQAAAGRDPAEPLELRLEALAAGDARWSEALGPQRLLRADRAADDALPAELWWAALAAAVRCFPGLGPDSTCHDSGDAPAGAPESVFDRLIHDLEGLTGRTRSLVVIDWQQNREIGAAIRRALP